MWFSYRSNEFVLKGISLKIREGGYYAVMGENGSGKTTLLKHMNGLLRPVRGRVIVDGLDTSKVKTAQLARKVAITFQNPESMFFSPTVYDEVAFALRNFGIEKETVDRLVKRALGLFGLLSKARESPFSLSEGEKRRLCFACVLAWDPKYIVMDEPTAGQDSYQKEVLQGVIRQLVSQRRAVIIASHDVEFVAETKPYVFLMKNGKIVGEGEAEELLTNRVLLEKAGLVMPQIPETFSLLGSLTEGFPIDVKDAVEVILRAIEKCTP